MNSDILLQTALPRSTNKISLIKSISNSYGIQPSYLRSVILAQSKIGRTQDIAFGYQFKLSMTYLALNYIDIVFHDDEDDDGDGDGDGEEGNGKNGKDEPLFDVFPIVPQKMDFLFSQLSLLDKEVILTSSNDVVLPIPSFPDGEFVELLGNDKVIEFLNKNFEDSFGTKISPKNNQNDKKVLNFFHSTPLNPLKTKHHNSNVIGNYNKLYPREKHQDTHRFRLCGEDLSLLDCLSILTACFSPALFLLALHNICELIMVDPEQYEKLSFFWDDENSEYILFPTKHHFVAYFQIYLADYTEFIPYNANRDEALFLSAQIPPSLIVQTKKSNNNDEKLMNSPEMNKYAVFAGTNTSKRHLGEPSEAAWGTKWENDPTPDNVNNVITPHHPSVLDQLTAPASDPPALRQLLRDYYIRVLKIPDENNKNKNKSEKSIDNQPAQQLSYWAQLPRLSETSGAFQDVLKLYYYDYLYNPATVSDWLSGRDDAQKNTQNKKTLHPHRNSQQITNIIEPSSEWYPYPMVPSLKQLGRVQEDYTSVTPCQLFATLQSIIRQNNYRAHTLKETNHLDTSLTIFTAWQYVQMQDMLILYMQFLAYLEFQNAIFFEKIKQILVKFIVNTDSQSSITLSKLLILDKTSVGGHNNAKSMLYLNNNAYLDLFNDDLQLLSFYKLQGKLLPPREPRKYTLNNVHISVDITSFIPGRFIFPTNLSLLSLQLLSSNFLQPRLLSHALTSTIGRGFYNKQPMPMVLRGQFEEMMLQSNSRPINTIILSFYEIILFSQAVLSNSLIYFLFSKINFTDNKLLNNATLHNATSILLEKSKSPPIPPPTNLTPKKLFRELAKSPSNPLTPLTPSSSIDPDHLLNRISSNNGPGRKLFNDLDPESVFGFLVKEQGPRELIKAVYCAVVEYSISFSLAALFTNNTLDKLKNINSLVDWNFGEENEIKNKNNTPHFHTILFPKILNSEQIAGEITSKVNTTGFLPPPTYHIHTLTPLTIIDLFPNERQTFTNRLVKLKQIQFTQTMNPGLFSMWSSDFEKRYISFAHDRRTLFWSQFFDANSSVIKTTSTAQQALINLIGPTPQNGNWMEELKMPPDNEESVDDNQPKIPPKFNNFSPQKKELIKNESQRLKKESLSAVVQVIKSYFTVNNNIYSSLLMDKFFNLVDLDSIDEEDVELLKPSPYEEQGGQVRYKLLPSSFRQVDIAYRLLNWCQVYFNDRSSPASLSSQYEQNNLKNDQNGQMFQSLGRQASLGVNIHDNSGDNNTTRPFGVLLERQKTLDCTQNSPQNPSRRLINTTGDLIGPDGTPNENFFKNKKNLFNLDLPPGYTTPVKGTQFSKINADIDELDEFDEQDDDDYDDFYQNNNFDEESQNELQINPEKAPKIPHHAQTETNLFKTPIKSVRSSKHDSVDIDAPLEAGLHNPLDTSLDRLTDTSERIIDPFDDKPLLEAKAAAAAAGVDLIAPLSPVISRSPSTGTLSIPGRRVQSAGEVINHGDNGGSKKDDGDDNDGDDNDVKKKQIKKITSEEATTLLDRYFSKKTPLGSPSGTEPVGNITFDKNEAKSEVKKPFLLPPFTILSDNPLLQYTSTHLEKMTKIQKTRCCTRQRQLNTLFVLEVENSMQFSSSSDDDDDGEKNSPKSENRTSKWSFKRIDLTHALNSNKIGSVSLENIFELDEIDQKMVTDYQNEFKKVVYEYYESTDDGILDKKRVNDIKLGVLKEFDKKNELKLIQKYVQFDMRFQNFVSNDPQNCLYP